MEDSTRTRNTASEHLDNVSTYPNANAGGVPLADPGCRFRLCSHPSLHTTRLFLFHRVRPTRRMRARLMPEVKMYVFKVWIQTGCTTCLPCHAAWSGTGMGSASKQVTSFACLSAGKYSIRCGYGPAAGIKVCGEFASERESKGKVTTKGSTLTCGFLVNPVES